MDITGDYQSDVTFETPLQNIPDWGGVVYKCGLLKSGEGTLRLASTVNTFTGPTVVTQGVLRVDGALITSAVTIRTNGGLGGTGTVSTVTMEDGAHNTPFLQVTGMLTGTFSQTAWTVLMDGTDETPNLNIGVSADGIIYARWAPRGTRIKLF